MPFVLAWLLMELNACARSGPTAAPVPHIGGRSVEAKHQLPIWEIRRCGPPPKLSEEELARVRMLRHASDAEYLRLCDSFPPVEDDYGPSARGEFEVCVHPDGFVYDVRVKSSTGFDAMDDRFLKHARTWRYAPIIADAGAVPFCHLIIYERKRGVQADGRLP